MRPSLANVRMILKRKPELSLTDKAGKQAIFHAIDTGSARLVGMLLRAGADPFANAPCGLSMPDYVRHMHSVPISMTVSWHMFQKLLHPG